LLAKGLSRSAASRQLAQSLQGSPGWTRRRLYDLSLQIESFDVERIPPESDDADFAGG
jgi:hypothetical protein